MRNGSYVSLAAAAAMLAAGCSSPTVSAEAGDDFVVAVGGAPTFDGCASSGDIDSYTWEIVEAPDAMADDAGKEIKVGDSNCSFELEAAMGFSEVGQWVIELTVTAGDETSTDQVTVEVTDG